MEYEKFYGAEDAAEYAASLCSEWQTDEEIWDADTLIGVAETADSEGPLDEELDPEVCYVVDEYGAFGITNDDGETVDWVATPTHTPQDVTGEAPGKRFCPFCGAEVGDGWGFCQSCGHKL